MPEEAHQQLQSLCHCLHLLAQLSRPEIPPPPERYDPRHGGSDWYRGAGRKCHVQKRIGSLQ
ncbi:MAG: hypothetical protein ACREO0_00600 [Pseudoxanthomonas sp.]